ncbi:tyrosine-type recombinase/integrase [Alkalihalobacillus trypoxylicola]|uniref:Tyr recombinase domain-containing protein n=1 Tax=Alkalihalobacillus trypoxylicola TaxID=519424 RepID=A0A162FCS0_9BACI|nr:tyrosine-type recombinase/integrase [Alkalihalobacillus trypoxylicola]KYG35309.1 hypothetical protein AZF04_02945 [Alkalihalobacillus trypoxylicola]
MIPIQKRTVDLIKELIKHNSDFYTDHIFVTDYGKPLEPAHFRKQLKLYAKKAGITKSVYPHLFRHTAATMFLKNGGDMRHLQMILGHQDLRMIQRYTHLTTKGIAKNVEQYTPINRLPIR